MRTFLKTLVWTAVVTALLTTGAAAVYEGYDYLYDQDGRSVPSVPTYRAKGVVSIGNESWNGQPAGALSGPKDMFAGSDGRLYIADTVNNRVVILDQSYKIVNILSELTDPDGLLPDSQPMLTLNNPNGLFVDRAGNLYVCDTDNARVLKTDAAFRILQVFEKPASKAFPQQYEFKPLKVVVDSAGVVYVNAYGIYQGLVSYNQQGEFIKFFGSLEVEETLAVQMKNFWQNFLAQGAGDQMALNIPGEYSNSFIDENDFIYGTIYRTQLEGTQDVRKLNALGYDVLSKRSYGDQEFTYSKGDKQTSLLVDVHADEEGIMSVLDRQRGHVFQYDKNQNLIAVFGGKGQQDGYFSEPSAIEKMGDCYLILDEERGTVTIMEPLPYMNTIRTALIEYNAGENEKARQLWQECLKYNSNFGLAHRSLGKIHLQNGDIDAALDSFRFSGDEKGYSDAYQIYRKDFFRRHFVAILLGLIVLFLAFKYGLRFIRKWLGLPVRGKKKRS